MQRIIADFSAFEGTNCYCSAESAERIRQAIADLPLQAFHCIGTGDYHYQTLFWLERIAEPFSLVLFDHHPDDQPGAFGEELLSCGAWVAYARRLPLLQADCWIRDRADFPALDKLPDLPVYVSVDLDVLSQDYARTDWDQGTMTQERLFSLLESIFRATSVLGVDICGELTGAKGGREDDRRINRQFNKDLYNFINNCI